MVSQLGDNIIDFFESSNRGPLQSTNDNGVDIEYIALSMEPFGEDRNTINLSVNNGYSFWGLDAAADRSMPREGFSTFSGFPASSPPGALGFTNRRRIVVIDATNSSNLVVRHNDLPLSNGTLGTENINLIRAAINAVEPAPEGVDYASWSTNNLAGSDETGFEEDPDRDGWSNGIEFSAGTDPLNQNSTPLLEFSQTATGFRYSYQQASDRVGISHQLQTGPLESLNPFEPAVENLSRESMAENIEKITVTLPADFGPFLRQAVVQE